MSIITNNGVKLKRDLIVFATGADPHPSEHRCSLIRITTLCVQELQALAMLQTVCKGPDQN